MVAIIFGILSVLYSRLEHHWVYPFGLVNTLIYTWLCYDRWGLYAEASLNFYYTVMSVYGWALWARKKDGTKLPITRNDKKDWLICVVFFLISLLLLFFILKRFTNSSVPFFDSLASATAYTGMWQMTKKKIENWLWWILTNSISIPLYILKGAVLTGLLYVVFLVLAIAGWREWNHRLYQSSLLHAK